MGFSMNRGTPKSSILDWDFSIINHPCWSFWGTPMTMETSWNLHIPSSKWHDFVWREDSDSKHQLKHTMPSKHTMRYTPWSVASRGLSKLISLQFADWMVTKLLYVAVLFSWLVLVYILVIENIKYLTTSHQWRSPICLIDKSSKLLGFHWLRPHTCNAAEAAGTETSWMCQE